LIPPDAAGGVAELVGEDQPDEASVGVWAVEADVDAGEPAILAVNAIAREYSQWPFDERITEKTTAARRSRRASLPRRPPSSPDDRGVRPACRCPAPAGREVARHGPSTAVARARRRNVDRRCPRSCRITPGSARARPVATMRLEPAQTVRARAAWSPGAASTGMPRSPASTTASDASRVCSFAGVPGSAASSTAAVGSALARDAGVGPDDVPAAGDGVVAVGGDPAPQAVT
jgi:hypothetical protein